MIQRNIATIAVCTSLGFVLSGCSAPRISMREFQRPVRSPELDAYEVFVGKWVWTAQVKGSDDPADAWNGTAQWSWALDKRCLEGALTARNPHAEYDAQGIWTWDAKRHKYIWSMFNNWNFPQHGEGTYDAATKSWNLRYRSVGLDGTLSYGRYVLTIVDPNTIEWTMSESADPLHLIKKIEMTGNYKRTG